MSPDRRWWPQRHVTTNSVTGVREVLLRTRSDPDSPAAVARRTAEQSHFFSPLTERQIIDVYADFSGLVSQFGLIPTVNVDLDPNGKIENRATLLALADAYSAEDGDARKKALAETPFNQTRDLFGQLLTPLTPFVIFQGNDRWAISTTTSAAPDSKIEAEDNDWKLRVQRARHPQEDCFVMPWVRKYKAHKQDGRDRISVGRDAVRDFFFRDGINGHKKLYPSKIDPQSLDAWVKNLGSWYPDQDILPSLGEADIHLGAYIDQGVAEYMDAVTPRLTDFIKKIIVTDRTHPGDYLNLLTPLHETRALGYMAGVDCVAQTIVDLGENESYRGSADFKKSLVRSNSAGTLMRMGYGNRTVKGDSWNLNRTRVLADIANREVAILEARP